MIISLLIGLVPICWIGFIREGNKSASKDVIIAKSGKIVYWGYGANGDDTLNNFKMDGTTYVGISYLGSSDTWKIGKSVANIGPKSADETLNKIMNLLTAHDDSSTLYSVINKKGFKLYTIESTSKLLSLFFSLIQDSPI